ncbi:MAG: hypothetical protein U1B80_09430, partial [Anaerolineaceae bacterium]|nr:hypothetical protein [Anaerolineaceae bacterium]
MILEYVSWVDLLNHLNKTKSESIDFVVLLTGALDEEAHPNIMVYLDEINRVLTKNALLFVQGVPYTLPDIGVYLDKLLIFKYWIAIESSPKEKHFGLPSVHAGLLLFSKSKKFNIAKTRFPHQICSACKRSLRDWGGKAHLMNSEGVAISDVWKYSQTGDNYSGLTAEALNTVFALLGGKPAAGQSKSNDRSLFKDGLETNTATIRGIITPCKGAREQTRQVAEGNTSKKYLSKDQLWFPSLITMPPPQPQPKPIIEFPGRNVVLHGDA